MKKADALRQGLALLAEVRRTLKRAGVVSAAAEAEQIVSRLTGLDRLALYTGARPIGSAARRRVRSAAARRARRVPLGYVLGVAPFYGRDFAVSPRTLVPRPETEILVEEACRLLDQKGLKSPRILDLGTGSGCIALSLTLERPECKMTALDLSAHALAVVRKNLKIHGLEKKVTLLQSDLFGSLKRGSRFDMIVSNPPYVPSGEIAGLSREVRSEPRLALAAGVRGLDVIERLLLQAPDFLERGGAMLVEIGKGQSADLRRRLRGGGEWTAPRFVKDLNGIERLLVLQRN